MGLDTEGVGLSLLHFFEKFFTFCEHPKIAKVNRNFENICRNFQVFEWFSHSWRNFSVFSGESADLFDIFDIFGDFDIGEGLDTEGGWGLICCVSEIIEGLRHRGVGVG